MADLRNTLEELKRKVRTLERQACTLRDLYLDLSGSEKRFRGIVEKLPEGIMVTRDLNALYVNRSFAEIFAFTHPGEITAMESVEGLFSSETFPFIESNFQAITQGSGISSPYACEGQRRNGTPFWLEITSVLGQWGGLPVTVSTVHPLEQMVALAN